MTPEQRLAIHRARQDFIDAAARRVLAESDERPDLYDDDDRPVLDAARRLLELKDETPA